MTKFSVDVSIDLGFGTAIRVLGLWSAIVFLGLGDLIVLAASAIWFCGFRVRN